MVKCRPKITAHAFAHWSVNVFWRRCDISSATLHHHNVIMIAFNFKPHHLHEGLILIQISHQMQWIAHDVFITRLMGRFDLKCSNLYQTRASKNSQWLTRTWRMSNRMNLWKTAKSQFYPNAGRSFVESRYLVFTMRIYGQTILDR